MEWRHWVLYFSRLLEVGHDARQLDALADKACDRWPLDDAQIRFGLVVLLMHRGLARLDFPNVVFDGPAGAAV